VTKGDRYILMEIDKRDRYRGCLIGLAVGDAIGASVEFKHRGTFPEVTGMNGGGVYSLEPGEWTDDTSMALCLATSLIESNGFDPKDQMNRYYLWWTEGYMSSNGKCFDIGNTIKHALSSYNYTKEPYSGLSDPNTAGNGSIMRLAPIPMYYAGSREEILKYSGLSSKTTHGAVEAIEACQLMGVLIDKALIATNKADVLKSTLYEFESTSIQEINNGCYLSKERDEISGSGYVVDCLEAALWCFNVTNSYKDAVLKAVNLGDDTDTTAAVCGQIAGAFYGLDNIPDIWKDTIVQRNEIYSISDRLIQN
jgi:ADP-ribosyl-[dinitrogen reductase] hydrolase